MGCGYDNMTSRNQLPGQNQLRQQRGVVDMTVDEDAKRGGEQAL